MNGNIIQLQNCTASAKWQYLSNQFYKKLKLIKFNYFYVYKVYLKARLILVYVYFYNTKDYTILYQ